MAKTNFDQYVEKKRKSPSVESRVAREVFSLANELASALMKVRKASGMTQRALAEKSGVQRADISRMEKGSLIPTMEVFLMLMGALGVTVILKVGEKPKQKNAGRLVVEVAGSSINPVTPGELLLEEFMIPFGITADRLAKEIFVPAREINAIVKGKRSVTAEIDLRLSRFFKLSDGYWLHAQIAHDIALARLKFGEELVTIKPWSSRVAL